jgi:hypothetical protein
MRFDTQCGFAASAERSAATYPMSLLHRHFLGRPADHHAYV